MDGSVEAPSEVPPHPIAMTSTTVANSKTTRSLIDPFLPWGLRLAVGDMNHMLPFRELTSPDPVVYRTVLAVRDILNKSVDSGIVHNR